MKVYKIEKNPKRSFSLVSICLMSLYSLWQRLIQQCHLVAVCLLLCEAPP